MWRRLIRSRGFVLLIFAVIFSFGILGQVDTRMHIGGSDWDLDSLIYINVDDYILEELVSQDTVNVQVDQEQTLEPPSKMHAQVSLDEVAEVTSKASTEAPVEVALLEAADSAEETVSRVEATVPVAEPPQVEEKKEEKATIFVHKVHSGETLWDIAAAYGVTINTILSANELRNPNYLSIGQELQIPSVNGVLHQVASGESLWEISERYDVSMEEITRVNQISDPNRIQPNTKLVIPGATQLRPRDVLLVNGQLQKAFDWPVRGRISSTFGPRWGRMHNGLDIAVATGTQVKAAADGRVTFAGWNGGYGILVIIDHGNGIETRYAHNSRLNVKVGQRVTRGETVAYSGNTGVSTGPHVHFEIRYRNNPVNPQTYLK
ncbi:MAG TPA: peptidoglycan DD-metalloendopeptidase family protein [Firmicutes bacterium]|nr:peptidoglycan DD-metalloendopeptidase family protein [Bacillota bacterium]